MLYMIEVTAQRILPLLPQKPLQLAARARLRWTESVKQYKKVFLWFSKKYLSKN